MAAGDQRSVLVGHRFHGVDDGVIAGVTAHVAGHALRGYRRATEVQPLNNSSWAVSSMPDEQNSHCAALRSDEFLLQIWRASCSRSGL